MYRGIKVRCHNQPPGHGSLRPNQSIKPKQLKVEIKKSYSQFVFIHLWVAYLTVLVHFPVPL